MQAVVLIVAGLPALMFLVAMVVSARRHPAVALEEDAANPIDKFALAMGTRVELPKTRPLSWASAMPLDARLVHACAGLVFFAGAIHAAVIIDHFAEYWLFGAFFAFVATAQFVWAARVVSAPRRWMLVAGIAGNLALVALWLASRTWGLPVGPAAGRPEPVGLMDVIATVSEVGGAALGTWCLLRRGGIRRVAELVGPERGAVLVSLIVAFSLQLMAPHGH